MAGFLRKLRILWFAWKSARLPLHAKLLMLAGIVYIISPLDIVPDVIPLLGIVDDIGIIPLFVTLAFRMLPDDVRRTKHAPQDNVIDVEPK